MEIYTVGYGRLSFAQLLSLLRKHSIETVVDVRSAPYSKFSPEFCKSSLKSLLASQGIKYLFLSDKKGENQLGGKPNDPSVIIGGVIYYELIKEKKYFKEGIQSLLETAKGRRVCLLCAEEDPNRCHRHHLITKTLLCMGVNVHHIRADARIEEAVFDQEQALLTDF
jgi:uncharacterized protein (DUF488 family)